MLVCYAAAARWSLAAGHERRWRARASHVRSLGLMTSSMLVVATEYDLLHETMTSNCGTMTSQCKLGNLVVVAGPFPIAFIII